VVAVARGPLEAGVYDRRAGGRVLSFRPSTGLHAVMNDEQTGSDWSAEGLAVGGPLQGQRLAAVDGYVVEWHVWSAYHRGAEVFGVELFSAGSLAPASPNAPEAFPSLTLPDLRGRPRPVALTGRVNLVVLWAAWCPPCRTELPGLARLAQARAAEGLAAVGIALHLPDDEHERAAAERFAAAAKVGFPTLLVDEPAYDRLEALARRAGRPGLMLPTVFVVDGAGRVRSVLTGTDVETLPRVVEELLRPPDAPAAR
jgi:cytochrome c biogenesis protein CcmG, thiol:disulfide interchange protein DsbE